MTTHYYTLISSLPQLGTLFGQQRLPISHIKLQNRLAMLEPDDLQCLHSTTELLWSEKLLHCHTDDELTEWINLHMPRINNATIKAYTQWQLEARTALAALGLRRQDNTGGLKLPGYGAAKYIIRKNWQAPYFCLEYRFPFLPEAKQLLDEKNSAQLHQLWLKTQWHKIKTSCCTHFFNFEAVMFYLLQWQLIRSAMATDTDQAITVFKQLVDRAMTDLPPSLADSTSL